MVRNKRKSKKILVILIVVIGIVISVGLFTAYYLNRKIDNRVKASGTVEVTQVQLSPQAGGRIIEFNVEETAVVKKGDLIAKLSLDGADEEVRIVKAVLSAANQQFLEAKNGARYEDIAKAKAELELRTTQYEQAKRDNDRFRELAKDGVVSTREAELYSENASAKRSAVKMAQETVNLLKKGTRIEEKEMAKANVERAEAELARAKTLLEYKEFRSPVDGVILTKNYETGDLVGAGAAIATLGKMNDCWIKLYIPSTQLGRIKLGASAEVRIDAYPQRVFNAEVTEISQEAEYNPRLSLTQRERANMVFWIKIKVENMDGILKPGMPADVIIL